MAISCLAREQLSYDKPILEHLLKGGQLKVVHEKDGSARLVGLGILERLYSLISFSWRRKNLKKVTAFLLENQSDRKVKEISKALLGQKYWGCSKVLQDFERREVATLEEPSKDALSEKNQKELNKWNRYAGEKHEKVFLQFPDFTDWLRDSKLLSQIKICRDPDAIKVVEGEPKVKVTLFDSDKKWNERETVYMNLKQLQSHFTFGTCKERQKLVIQGIHTSDVYTFLDNGKGLQAFDLFDLSRKLIKKPIPIAMLNDRELQQAQDIAQKFDRDDKPTHNPFVLQIVGFYAKGKNLNLLNFLERSRHVYLRIIASKDDPKLGMVKGGVYEMGFGRKKGRLPFSVQEGRVFALDPFEYLPCEERIVTYIPTTQKEARKIFNFTRYCHESQEIGYHVRSQNCAAFVREAVSCAEIHQNGKDIAPTEISLSETLLEITPDVIQPHVKQLIVLANGERKVVGSLPNFANQTINKSAATVAWIFLKFIEWITLVLVVISGILLGGLSTTKAKRMNKNAEPTKELTASLWKFKNWVSLKGYIFNFPAVLQGWQRAQNVVEVNHTNETIDAPTIIYKNPQRLAILPKLVEPVEEVSFLQRISNAWNYFSGYASLLFQRRFIS